VDNTPGAGEEENTAPVQAGQPARPIGSIGRSLSPLARLLLAVALTGLVLVLIHWAADVLTPLMVAFFLLALAMPSYRWLQARGVKQGLALLLLIVALIVGGGLLLALVLLAAGRLQTGLAAYGEQLVSRFQDVEAALAERGIEPGGSGWAAASASGLLGGLLAAIVDVASGAIVSLVIVAFFLLESSRFIRILKSDRVRVLPVLGEVPRVARTAVQYFGIRTRLNLVTGAGVSALCLILGVDYPLLWGVTAFFLSYIPYIGLATAMIPPALLALAEFGWVQALIVVVAITAINLLIENILEPGYTGRQLQLSPTVVFFSFFFWAWLLGPAGALLSMPITVLLLLVFRSEEGTRWMADLIDRDS
jgi:predicted PurR-regulated permease PerM